MSEANQILDTRMVEIAHNDRVPVAEIIAAADPRCRYCTGGFQQPVGGKARVCGCVVRTIMRMRRGQTPSSPAVTVEKDQAAERERLQKRLAELRAQAAAKRADLGRRMADYDEGVDAASERLAGEEQALVALELDSAAFNDAIEREQDWLRAETARRNLTIEELVEKRYDVQRKSYVHTQARLDAERELASVRARAQRRLDETAGARHRLENLERKIALIEARHAGLLHVGGTP